MTTREWTPDEGAALLVDRSLREHIRASQGSMEALEEGRTRRASALRHVTARVRQSVHCLSAAAAMDCVAVEPETARQQLYDAVMSSLGEYDARRLRRYPAAGGSDTLCLWCGGARTLHDNSRESKGDCSHPRRSQFRMRANRRVRQSLSLATPQRDRLSIASCSSVRSCQFAG